MKKYLYALKDRLADCVLGVMMSPQNPDDFVEEQNRENALMPKMDRSTMTIHLVGTINDVTGSIDSDPDTYPQLVGDYMKSVNALENRRRELNATGKIHDPADARKQV